MAFSIIQTTATGSTNAFPINFTLGFNNRNEVTCQVNDEVDGLGDPVYRSLDWVNDGLVNVLPATLIPAATKVVFKRTVSKTALAHDYANGEAIDEINLDESNKQNLMAIHELFDGRFTSPFQQDLDMGTHKITNLVAGSAGTDAVNKTQLDAVSAVANASASAAAASDASAAAALADRLLADADVVTTHADVVLCNASVAAVGPMDLSGTQTLDDTIMWSTGVSKYIRRSLAYLKTQLGFSAFGTTLVGSANAAAARSTLGAADATLVAPLASPTFTGTPIVPTAAAGTNTTQAASTAFALANRSVAQVVSTIVTTVNTGTTIIPLDDTIPQNTEGTEFMTLAITPKDTANRLEITVVLNLSSSLLASMTVALFQDSTANALAAQWITQAAANYGNTVTFKYTMAAGTTSATTFKVRAGSAGASTVTINGSVGARLLGGVCASSITITEYRV